MACCSPKAFVRTILSVPCLSLVLRELNDVLRTQQTSDALCLCRLQEPQVRTGFIMSESLLSVHHVGFTCCLGRTVADFVVVALCSRASAAPDCGR